MNVDLYVTQYDEFRKELERRWWHKALTRQLDNHIDVAQVKEFYANLLSQPTLRREGNARAHGCVFHGRKMHEVATNVYSRKTSEKPEKVWSTNFKCERFGSCIYARGRY